MTLITKPLGGNSYLAYHQSDGVLDETLASGNPRFLDGVLFHITPSGGDGADTDLLVQLDSGISTSHDVVLLRVDMATSTDLFWQPEYPWPMDKDDALVVSYSNGNSGVWGVQVFWRTR